MRPRPSTLLSSPTIGSRPPAIAIRIQNSRAIGATVLYCQTSTGMNCCPRRSRNRPLRCARNDETAGLPTTSVNRKYLWTVSGSDATCSCETAEPGDGGVSAAASRSKRWRMSRPVSLANMIRPPQEA